jgi:hypothetical protein
MSNDIGAVIVREMLLFAEPLTDIATDPGAAIDLFTDLGWNLDAITGLPITRISTALQAVNTVVVEVQSLPLPPASFDDISKILGKADKLRSAIVAVHDLFDAAPAGSRPPGIEQLAPSLLNLLTVRYLQRTRLGLSSLLELLGIVRQPAVSELPGFFLDPTSGRVVRFPADVPLVDLARVPELLRDPVAALRSFYAGPGTVVSADLARRLFPQLDAFVATIAHGAVFRFDPDATAAAQVGIVGEQLARASAVLFIPTSPSYNAADTGVGAILTLSAADNGGLGLAIVPFGTLTLTWAGQSWIIEVRGSASGGTISLTLHGVTFSDASGQIRLDLSAKKISSGRDPAVLLGPPTGTRLEVGTLTLSGSADLDTDQPPDIGLLIEVGKAALAVAAGDGDGFLAKILPPGGFRTDFDLAVGWSTRRGLYLRGSAKLDAHIPVHTTFLGVLTIETVDLAIAATTEGANAGVTIVAGATTTAHLGPVTANIQQIGVALNVTAPAGGGNLGPANLAIEFHPPVGVGLAIDAGPVSGGGFLLADYANGRYGGVLQLEIGDTISATAIGSLTVTPNPAHPDAAPGYSLLLIVVAEFPPIQLGFGFTLDGLGGVLGANRTMNVEALRAGVRTRTLDSILFPENAAANATRILHEVETVFPPAPGQFVIGLMGKLGWGTPTLLTIELGLILELPAPLRIALLGRLGLTLPEPDAAVIELHLDVLGILDLTNKNLSIDASLYDSRIAVFAISGDMAARLNFGADPSLAIAAGGFNPRFTPPPSFPTLRRLTISLAAGDNPRIRLEAYLATTTNSVQMGARLDLYVAADLGVLGKFSASAYLSFDALVQLVPLSFVIDLGGGVDIRRNGAILFAAELRLSLSGPQPVHVWGYAQLVFLGRHRIPFDHTFGEEPPPVAVPPGDPLGDLWRALADPGNWQAQLPADGHTLVSLRDLPPAADTPPVLAHPLGELTFRQRIVPLDVPIDRYAGAPAPDNARLLHVAVSLGGATATGTPLRDAFPTGEFLDLTDDQKLSHEQFSQWPCGLARLQLGGTVSAGIPIDGVDGYETTIVNPVARTRQPAPPYTLGDAILPGLVARGAAATGPLRRSGAAAHVGAPLGVTVRAAGYRIVDATDLTVADVDGTGVIDYASESEADAARRRAGDPTRQLVVGAHEGSRP